MAFVGNLFGLLTAILVIAYTYYKWSFQYWKKRNIPFIEGHIPFGTVDNPLTRTVSLGDQIALFYKKARKNGWKHCGIYALAAPIWLVTDLDLVKNVMAKDFHHFVDRHWYKNEKDDPISAHLFSLGGKKWRNLRTKLTPTFTSGKLKVMFQTLVDCGLVLQRYFDETLDTDEPVDIKDVLGRFSTDVIGSCAFGLDCNSFKEPNTPFRVHGKRAFAFTKLQMAKLTFSFNFPTLANALGLRFFPKSIEDFFYKIVKDTVDYREKNNVVRHDFMQLMIDMKNKQDSDSQGDGTTLTMDEITAQCFIFFIAGFETSSTTMTFALYEMAINPEVQERVRDEIKTVLARYDNKMSYESLSELKYMKQVIDEVLRKYPPLPYITRICVEDYKVPGEDVIIEKGTGLMIPVKGIHYDEEYYDNPEKFDPDRFTEERKRGLNKFAHIPFGEGPRICIGERFGVMQTKVGLTSILQKFKVKLDKRTKMPLKMAANTGITTVDGDMWLNFEKI